ncbi:hypothetical protein P3W33_18065 [Luteibacter sp. PPL552]
MSSRYARQRGGTRFAHCYGTARWQRVRAAQLAQAPLCAMCTARGLTVAATVCDHVNGHPAGETEAMFWNGPFQSLCAPCHSGDKARMERGKERRGCDAHGWPL